ncbi:TIGR03364 family FAD-dependent oxidoreductase [Alcaligenes endophyticus]|uniref:TIGR03364 family FAD-dependent oxidoreductase n=1 Tax=Alcaligenes endophyticus TaxID=1929088 RepID=A0ABT8EIF8_9BURK|nr:TIGR03364 family FAD-dependent oxidoreductase [Alcaligenes endophyticus]MCX5592578.1 TIGR03364 family FAD-dependent oxidoreductase [Alcaligenes endophyticus]MDN4121074.1 TIGR03364 family FAD-dependent oxidoreductase [Alcaligenes endophyticus]
MKHYDVLVVGGGILGVGHAWAAARRGLRVALLERSHQAQGASIRNFGQVLITGQAPGVMLELARESRELWLRLAQVANFQVRNQGSLFLARNHAEMQTLENYVVERAPSLQMKCELLTAQQVGQLFAGRLAHHHGALQGLEDLQLYSRAALPAITYHLESIGVDVLTGVHVHAAAQGELESTAGSFKADTIFICPGHDYISLHKQQLEQLSLSVSRLQMLKIRAQNPIWQTLDRPLLTGLSCLHYGAFSDLPAAQELRRQVENQAPELLERGIHLLISPSHDGNLIIGDSHDYGPQASPFNQERTDEMLLELAQAVLASPVKVIERWQGIYGAKGPGPYSVLKPDEKTWISLMHTGLGMSTGLAIAERNMLSRYGLLPA